VAFGHFRSRRDEPKQVGFRGDFAAEKNNKKSANGPLLSCDYYGIIWAEN